MYQLVIFRGRNHFGTHDLVPGTHVIGRSADADVQVDHEAVSRRHLKITVAGRRMTAEDLDTTNGTFINGCAQPVRDLALGDAIELGHWTLRVQTWNLAEQGPNPPATSGAPEDVHSTVLHNVGELAAQRERTSTLLSDHLVTRTDGTLHEHRLDKRLLTIGYQRGDDVQLAGGVLFGRTVAEVTRDPVGWLIRGMSGIHPVRVNGRKIRDHRLRDGDVIQVRSQTLRFHAAV